MPYSERRTQSSCYHSTLYAPRSTLFQAESGFSFIGTSYVVGCVKHESFHWRKHHIQLWSHRITRVHNLFRLLHMHKIHTVMYVSCESPCGIAHRSTETCINTSCSSNKMDHCGWYRNRYIDAIKFWFTQWIFMGGQIRWFLNSLKVVSLSRWKVLIKLSANRIVYVPNTFDAPIEINAHSLHTMLTLNLTSITTRTMCYRKMVFWFYSHC